MDRYDFTNDNGTLKIVIQSQGGLNPPEGMSLSTPSLIFANNTIKLYNSGHYTNSYLLTDIGLIGGLPVTNINEAYDALSALIGPV